MDWSHLLEDQAKGKSTAHQVIYLSTKSAAIENKAFTTKYTLAYI